MADTIGDAKLRIVIDTSQAKRTSDQAEKDEKRREDRRAEDRERREDGRRPAPAPGGQPAPPATPAPGGRTPRIPGITPEGRRNFDDIKKEIRANRTVQSLAGIAVGIGAAAVLAEEYGPVIRGARNGLLGGSAAGDAMNAAFDPLGVSEGTEQIVRELRARISAISDTLANMQELMIGRVVAANDPGSVDVSDAPGLATAFYEINSFTRRMERQKRALTREMVGEAVGAGLRNEMVELFKSAMGGQ